MRHREAISKVFDIFFSAILKNKLWSLSYVNYVNSLEKNQHLLANLGVFQLW